MIGVIIIEANLKILLNIDMVLIGEEAEADGKVGESSKLSRGARSLLTRPVLKKREQVGKALAVGKPRILFSTITTLTLHKQPGESMNKRKIIQV